MKTGDKIYFLSLLILLTHAKASTFERYCFSSKEEALSARGKIQNISAPVDIITLENSCLVISTNERRREVLQKYLLHLYPNLNIAFSSADTLKSDQCRLKVEKTTHSQDNRTDGYIGNKAIIKNTQTKSTKTELSSILVTSGETFELKNEEELLIGKCTYLTPARYSIKLSMLFVPRPVNAYDPSTYKQKSGTEVSTTVTLTQGQKINIAQISSQLKDDGKKLNLVPSFKKEANDGSQVQSIYLMLEE